MTKSVIGIADLNRLAANMAALETWCNQTTPDPVQLPSGNTVIPLYKIASVANDIDDGNIPTSAITGLNDYISNLITQGTVLQNIVQRVSNTQALTSLKTWDGRVVLVDGQGGYQFSASTNKWTALGLNASVIQSGVDTRNQADFNQWITSAKANASDVYSRSTIDNTLSTYATTSALTTAVTPLTQALTQLQNNKLDVAGFNDFKTGIIAALKLKADSTTLSNKQDVITAGTVLTPVSNFDNSLLGVSQPTINNALQSLVNRTEFLNNNKLTTVANVAALFTIAQPADGFRVYVNGDGIYGYSSATTTWTKDNRYNEYDFKTAQPVQYYYDILGNWDDAIFQAQLNVYLKGYSPKLLLPAGEITTYKPILSGAILGMKIHNYLKDKGIESNFYDATTKRFKSTWRLCIHGAAAQATRLACRMCSDRTDKTYKNMAAIFVGLDPSDSASFLKGGNDQPFWNTGLELSDINIVARFNNVPYDMEMTYAYTHAIYVGGGNQQNATKCLLTNLNIDGFVGGGIVLDNVYDSSLLRVTMLRCGRMLGGSWDYGFTNKLPLSKQLFAPLTIMNTNGDNSNFIRALDMHFELNVQCVADIIVTGNSSPVWIERTHHESGNWGGGYADASLNMKVRMAVGMFGAVNFLSSDDPTSTNSTGGGGGYINCNGTSGYNEGYSAGLVMSNYTTAYLCNESVPSGIGDIIVNTGNDSARLFMTNVSCANVKFSGGNSNRTPFQATNCVFSGNIEMVYANPPKLTNCTVGGDIKLSSVHSINNEMVQFTNVSCTNLIGDSTPIYGATGDITVLNAITGFYPRLGRLRVNASGDYLSQMVVS